MAMAVVAAATETRTTAMACAESICKRRLLECRVDADQRVTESEGGDWPSDKAVLIPIHLTITVHHVVQLYLLICRLPGTLSFIFLSQFCCDES